MYQMEQLNDKELDLLHDYSIKTLEDPGMRILNDAMLRALKEKGARVDLDKKVVQFTPAIVNETIGSMMDDLKNGQGAKYLNGVTSEKDRDQRIKAKFGGACIQVFDWKEKKYREPGEEDLVNMVKLGESLPDVATVGNPVVCLRDRDGNAVDPNKQRIRTAATVAKYTQKAGPTEVWNAKELDFLIEIGMVVRGSKEAFLKDPCFITAKETISPLILEDKSAEVLIALAKRGLPCIIVPMPISGVSSPVQMFGNVIVGNAEILGTAAALKSVVEDARIIGGMISGTMNMKTGTASFAGAEATLQDLALAELHEKRYGLNFGIGGYSDAKYPGVQSVIERQFKFFALALSGRRTYPVGLANWGKCFSPEQALIDLETIKSIHRFLKGMQISQEDEVLGSIRKAGIGGSFLQEEHTLLHYKEHMAVPELLDQTLSAGFEQDVLKDIMAMAHHKVEAVLRRDDHYRIGPEKEKEIDRIVRDAEKILAL